MTLSSSLSRRNAVYDSFHHRSSSSSAASSSLSSSTSTSSLSSDDHDDSYDHSTIRTSLFLQATKLNEKTAKIERTRERRMEERRQLEEKGEWRTSSGFIELNTSIGGSESVVWASGGEATSVVAAQEEKATLGLSFTPLAFSPTKPPSPSSLTSSASTRPTRPTLYPLLIPTHSTERPRSLQPPSRLFFVDASKSDELRRQSWAIQPSSSRAPTPQSSRSSFSSPPTARPKSTPYPNINSPHSSLIYSSSLYSCPFDNPTQSTATATLTQTRRSLRVKDRPLLLPFSSLPSVHPLAPTRPPIDLEGPLLVRTSRFAKFVERWCVVLQGKGANATGMLLVFETQRDPVPFLLLPLRHMKVLAAARPTHTFQLLTNGKRASLTFKASADKTAYAWMKSLMKGALKREESGNVFSSLAAETIPLHGAQTREQGKRGLLPEELRREVVEGWGSRRML